MLLSRTTIFQEHRLKYNGGVIQSMLKCFSFLLLSSNKNGLSVALLSLPFRTASSRRLKYLSGCFNSSLEPYCVQLCALPWSLDFASKNTSVQLLFFFNPSCVSSLSSLLGTVQIPLQVPLKDRYLYRYLDLQSL